MVSGSCKADPSKSTDDDPEQKNFELFFTRSVQFIKLIKICTKRV